MDEGYRRIKYVRYADDFIIGVIGSKSDCEAIKEDIKNFLGEKLKLTLSKEKTLITHGNRKAKFLGYEIYVRPFTDKTLRGEKSGVLIKAYGKKVVLEVPMFTMRINFSTTRRWKFINSRVKRNGNPQAGQSCYIWTTSKYWMPITEKSEVLQTIFLSQITVHT